MSTVTDSSINIIVQTPDTINLTKDFFLPLSGTLLGVIIGAILSYYFSLKLFKNHRNLNIANDLLHVVDNLSLYLDNYHFKTIEDNLFEIDKLESDYILNTDPFMSLICDTSNIIFIKHGEEIYKRSFRLAKLIDKISPKEVHTKITSNANNIYEVVTEFTRNKTAIKSELFGLYADIVSYKEKFT